MTRWLVPVDLRLVLVAESDGANPSEVAKDVRKRLDAGDGPTNLATFPIDWSLVSIDAGRIERLEEAS